MKVTRRLKITVTRTLRISSPPVRAFCPVCLRDVEALSCEQAVAFLEIDEQQLDGLVETGLVHAFQTMDGRPRICRDSVFARDTGEFRLSGVHKG